MLRRLSCRAVVLARASPPASSVRLKAMRTATAAWALALLLCGAAALTGNEPDWYSCECTEARDPSNCMCPDLEAPGGLPRDQVPQFILFTHDDSIEWNTNEYIRKVCDDFENPNKCPVRATMFTMVYYTDCDLTYDLWADGYEIATHTVSHVALTDNMDKKEVEYQIVDARNRLADECGIPIEDIRGFRNPYLQTAPESRKLLYENGFLYDSTLIEGRHDESLSNGMDERVWPYTLDFGIPQDCDWYAPAQICDSENEKYPGLWEVPLWTLYGSGKEYTMDPDDDDRGSLFDILKENFDEIYNGNRAPMPIYIHTPWFNDDKVADMRKFVEYTQSFGDVYWVTMTQLINWMKNPISADQLRTNAAMCGMAPSPPPPPPPPPPLAPLPASGINVTLTLTAPGGLELTPGMQSKLVARVWLMLGGTATGVMLRDVRSAAPAPPPKPPSPGTPLAPSAANASGPAAPPASQRRRRLQGTAGLAAAFPAGQHTGFLQYEAPAGRGPPDGSQPRAPPASGISAQSAAEGAAAPAAGPATLQLVFVTASPNPLAAYAQAMATLNNVTLGDTLQGLNLTLAAQPKVVPFKDGKVLTLPPPASPPPRPAPRPPAPAPTAAAGGTTPGSPANATDSSDSGGLPKWAAVEIAVFTTCGMLVALGALAGVVYWRRRVGRRRQAAATAAPSTLSRAAPAPASDADSPAEKGGKRESEGEAPQHTTITLAATAT
ncbi:hypothetical protein ABPG75_008870 [Micractinium tetrahymenae]